MQTTIFSKLRSAFIVALAVTQFLTNTAKAAPILHIVPFGYLEGRGKSMATDGSNVVVAFYSEVFRSLVKFGPDGSILSSSGGPPCMGVPYVAYARTNFLSVWLQGDTNSVDLRGQFFNGQQFTILAGLPLIDLRGLSWNGESFFVLWTHQSNGSSTVQGQLLDELAFPLGNPLTINSAGANAPECSVVGMTNHVVVWMESIGATNEWHARLRTISDEGALSTPVTLNAVPAGSANPVAIAAGKDGVMAVWNEERGPYHFANCSAGSPVIEEGYFRRLFGRMVSDTGTLASDPFQITSMGGEQMTPKAAFDGTNFFVVWADTRYCFGPISLGCQSGVYGQQVSPTGTLVNPELRIQGPFTKHLPESMVYAGTGFVLCFIFPHVATSEPDWDVIVSIRPADLGTMGFQTFVALSNGYSHVQFTGNVSRGSYRLQVSTNFRDWNWVPWDDVPGFSVALRPNYATRWLDPYTNYNGPRFYRALNSVDVCVSNLMIIQRTKDAWAFEQTKCLLDYPADSDLFGDGKYLPAKPVCPLGGTYSLDSVVNTPMCSLAAIAGHTL